MASFTKAEATNSVTGDGHTRRLATPQQAPAGSGAVGNGHERRLATPTLGDATTGAESPPHARRLLEAPQADARSVVESGIPVPTGAFRRVRVTLEDDDGNPLEEAVWVQSAGIFPTSAKVQTAEDGTVWADMWLLDGIAYDSFLCIGKNPDPGARFEYVWFEAEESNDVTALGDSAKLVFDPQKPLGGFQAGDGVFFG